MPRSLSKTETKDTARERLPSNSSISSESGSEKPMMSASKQHQEEPLSVVQQQPAQDAINTLCVSAEGDYQGKSSLGVIKVKLASASPQWDNKAEVEVDCDNPDEVVDKMLQSIVDKFPPTSAVTVQKGHGNVSTHEEFVQMTGQHVGMVQGGGLFPGAQQTAHQWGYRTNQVQVPLFPNPQVVKKQTTADVAMTSRTKKYSTVSSVSSARPTQTLMQEVPKFVPKVEIREIVKEVPKVEVEWVEKVVEVPQIQFVDKYEEVPQVQEVVRHVPKIETVEVPREVIKYVPKIETKIVEQSVEVPRGEKNLIVRPYPVDTCFVVPKFEDRQVPVIMSESIVPEIEETDEVVEVEVSKYVPYLVPVDVYVPRPVTVPLRAKDDADQREQPCTTADPALLQQLMIEMNPHLQQLEVFNSQQQDNFQSLIQQSLQQARDNNVEPPQPISAPLQSSCTNAKQTTATSRSVSMGGASRRPSRTSGQVSRRVTGINGEGRMPSTPQQHIPPPMTSTPCVLPTQPMYASVGMHPFVGMSSMPTVTTMTMQPGIHPAMQHGVHPAMQHGVHPAMQHGVHPAMQLGVHPAMQLGVQPALQPMMEQQYAMMKMGLGYQHQARIINHSAAMANGNSGRSTSRLSQPTSRKMSAAIAASVTPVA